MLTPDQFDSHEAWIAFKLNDTPLRTAADGDFDLFALMDAASRLIVATATVQAGDAQPNAAQARELFDQACAQADAVAATLFMPDGLGAAAVAQEARARSLTVVEIPLDQLLGFIGEARQSFRERFGG